MNELDITGVQLLDDTSLLKEKQSTPPASSGQNYYDFSSLTKNLYDPKSMVLDWYDKFKMGVNMYKGKYEEKKQIEEMAALPIDKLPAGYEDKVLQYKKENEKSIIPKTIDFFTKDVPTEFIGRVAEGLDTIGDLEFKYPKEGIIDIFNNPEYSKVDKLLQSGKAIGDTIVQNFAGNFDSEKFNQIDLQIKDEASKKIGRALGDPNISVSERVLGLGAGYLQFLTSPIMAALNEEATGPIPGAVGQELNMLSVGASSLISQFGMNYAGMNRKEADDLDFIVQSVIPGKLAHYELKGFSKSAAAEKVMTDIQAEISGMYGMDPSVRSAYLEVKKDQYGGLTYAKGVEQFDRAIEEAKVGGDINALKEIGNEVKKFNAERYNDFGKNILASAVVKIEGWTDKLGIKTKLQFVNDAGKEVPYIDLSQVSFGKGSDMIVKQELTQKALGDLASYWQEKGLAEIRKNEVKASVDQYLKETGLSDFNKKIFTDNLLQELRARSELDKTSVRNLYDIAQEKAYARDKYLKAKSDKYEGLIDESSFKKIEKEYSKQLDDVSTHKKYDEIKYQEAIGNLKEVGEDGPYTLYQWTNQGLSYLPREVRSTAVGYHFPTKLKNSIESAVDDKTINIMEKKFEDTFDALIAEGSSRSRSKLEKNWRKSGKTYEGYISGEIDKYLAKKEDLARMQTEIENSQAGSRIFVPGEVGSSYDVTGVPSTFPKWIPEQLRNKKEMEEAFKLFSDGKITVAGKTKKSERLQDLVNIYLDQIGSPLADNFSKDFSPISKNPRVEKIRKQTERLIQSKQVGKAIYTKYKKTKTEIKNLIDAGEKTKESLKKGKERWKQKYEEKTGSNRGRRLAVRTFAKAFELSDIEADKIVGNKDYFSFRTDYEFDQWLKGKEKEATEYLEKKAALVQLQGTIYLKELKNTKNLIKLYDLPQNMSDWAIEDIKIFEAVLEDYQKGDIFISPNLMKRFEIIGDQEIKTVREARDAMVRDLGEMYDMPIEDFEGTMYEARIKELREQLGQEEDAGVRAGIEQDIKDIEEQAKEASLRSKIKNENFDPKSEKTTDQKVTEKKLIKGNWYDKITPDMALVNQNPLYKYMVLSFNENRIKTLSKLNDIEIALGDKLAAARKSRPGKKLIDKLIPTDDLVFKYLESPAAEKMDLAKTMTLEELELANYVQGLFSDFRTSLSSRKVMDNFRENYITNLQKDWKEILKTDGIKAAFKSIFEKQENSIDFGALGGSDEVLGFEKFFKFSLQRTGGFDPSKDIGRAVMAYANTYYKKIALDETIPKVVLYKNLIADSKADKFIVQWLNNKKGITALPDLQGTGIDKIVSGLKQFTSLLDLGFNPITAGASIGGITLSNYIELGASGMARGIQRKLTPQGRSILKKYEAEIGRNPLWNLHREVLMAPDVPPLERPGQLAFVMLGQTLQSGINTAFLSKLTPEEFKTAEISPKRIAKIFNDLGTTHALPDSQSVYGSTFIGKFVMMYKSWAVPLLYTNGKNARKILNGTATKTDVGQFVRGVVVPALILYTAHKAFAQEMEEDYVVNRLFQEVTSSIGAMDLSTWLAIPRPAQFVLNLYESLMRLAKGEEYKTTKAGEYKEGDLKFWNQIQKLFTPGAIKTTSTLFEEKKKTGDSQSGKSSGSSGAPDLGNMDLGDIDLGNLDLGDIDLGSSSVDIGDIDLGNLDLGDLQL